MIKISVKLRSAFKEEVESYLKSYFNITEVEPDCVITDISSIKESLVIADTHTFVISDECDEENINSIQAYQLHHLIGLNEGIYLEELVDNIKKTKEKNIWGTKHYLGEELHERFISFSDSVNINEKIATELSHFQFEGYFSSPTDYLKLIANELLSNSLYKGPTKKRSLKDLEASDRKSPVFLKGPDLVQVSLASSTKGLALSVQDSFGELAQDVLIKNLVRSFKDKTPLDKQNGAGLGLYLTYLHSNQFIINLRKGFRTEVICIIDKNKRFIKYKSRIRSFHFFEEVTK